MAESVTKEIAARRGLADRVSVWSAGIGDFHVGETADPRTERALESAGYAIATHRAKQFQTEWFDSFDLVVALDRGQERVLRAMAPQYQQSKVRLLMQFEHDPETLDVSDPYYADEPFFAEVLQQIESACRRLFRQIEPALRAPGSAPRPPED